MSEKPTYEELEQRIKELKQEADSHKLVEEALRESETRYRMLAQYSQTGIYIHIGGLVKFVNNSFAEILGYTPEEIVGRQYWEFVHPGDREMVKKISLDRARGEAAPAEYEFRHLSKDGRTVWVHNLPTIIQYQGQTANMGNLAYITERKQAEEALRESEKLLSMAGHTARFGGWSAHPDGHEVVWSEQVALIHEKQPGYSPTAKEAIQYYAPEWRDKIAAVFQICTREGTPYDEEMEIITAGGHRLWVRTTGEPVRDNVGKIVRVQGSFQDISERKRAEQTLKNNQNFLNRIINQSPFATWISDEKGTMIKCNAALKNFLNITDEQLIGKYNVFEDEVAIEQGLIPKIRTVFGTVFLKKSIVSL
jgi:PAS domain S-box-containing protein